MNNLEWTEGYKLFCAFAYWARKHGFYIPVLHRMDQSFRALQGGR